MIWFWGRQCRFFTLCKKKKELILKTAQVAIHRKASLQGWPSGGVWEIGSQNIPSQQWTGKSGSLCLVCSCKHYSLCWIPAFFLVHLEFWYVLCRASLCDQPSIKILGAEPLMSFSGQNYHRHVALFLLLEGECALCDLPQERESRRKPTRGFLQILPVSSLMMQLCILTTWLQYILVMSTTICGVLWVLLANFQTWGGLENSNTYPQMFKGLNLYQNGINFTTTMTNNSEHL